jgi:hypothetical protein
MGDVRASDYFNDAMLRAHNDCNCASVTEATDRLGCSVRPWECENFPFGVKAAVHVPLVLSD